MCLCSASCQCICRVRALKEMWQSNSKFRRVEWEIATGNRGPRALFLRGWGEDKEPVPKSSREVVGVKPALQSLLKVRPYRPRSVRLERCFGTEEVQCKEETCYKSKNVLCSRKPYTNPNYCSASSASTKM